MLKLHIPTFEELNYRESLLKDPSTMEYNSGYDLGMPNYDINTGCIDFNKDYHESWYSRWVNVDKKFYAYLLDETTNNFIGEVSFRFDDDLDGYMIGITIEAKHRGKGYSKEGLKLLCEKAFNDYNAKSLYDDIPSSRVGAINLFKKQGFIVSEIYTQKKFNEDEEIFLMKLDNPNI